MARLQPGPARPELGRAGGRATEGGERVPDPDAPRPKNLKRPGSHVRVREWPSPGRLGELGGPSLTTSWRPGRPGPLPALVSTSRTCSLRVPLRTRAQTRPHAGLEPPRPSARTVRPARRRPAVPRPSESVRVASALPGGAGVQAARSDAVRHGPPARPAGRSRPGTPCDPGRERREGVEPTTDSDFRRAGQRIPARGIPGPDRTVHAASSRPRA
jgi:hypothetical protein